MQKLHILKLANTILEVVTGFISPAFRSLFSVMKNQVLGLIMGFISKASLSSVVFPCAAIHTAAECL